MNRRVPDRLVFALYALPVFFFPLSTAGASISLALFGVVYLASGYWRRWSVLWQRPWALPLALLIAWTLTGLLWTEDLHAGFKYAGAVTYGLLAFAGATLPWREDWLRLLIRLFLMGLLINAVLAALITWRIVPWHYRPHWPYVGFANHMWWTMALTHALIWLLWDMQRRWNYSLRINLVLAAVFFAELILSPGRSGQVLFVILVPVAAWLLYRGRWRYWALGLTAVLMIALAASPVVQSRARLGISNLRQFAENPATTTTSWGIRLAAMWGGLKMIENHPLAGVGTGDFRVTMSRLQRQHKVTETPGFTNDTAANSYITEAAVLGIPGLVLLLWFLTALTREIWRVRFTPHGWFALGYVLIFWIGGIYNTLIWGFADAISIAIFAGLPLNHTVQGLTKSEPPDTRPTVDAR